MYIIVGLGNPGKQYENTRHNMGFIAVDRLAERHHIKITKIKHKALVGEGRISGQKVVLVKPQTYMNLSGNSVRQVLEYYKEAPERLIVVYDDIDIAAGAVRMRKKGSAGTHNGMRSIIYDIQSDQFPRLRIGIGGERKMPLDRYVLGGFTKEEKPLLEGAVDRGIKALETLLSKGIDIAMSECNSNIESGEKEKNEVSEH